MNTVPHIAVLLPVYNPGDDFKLSLDSLRSQTVPFKLYLVDDGSKFITDYEGLTEGMDVQIIRLPQNLGITGAMNAGITEILKSSHPYVARLDSGDMCKPERFAKQMAYLDSHPDIFILGSAVEFRLRDKEGVLLDSHIINFPSTPEGSRKKLFFNIACTHPAMMFRREVFEHLKGYSEIYPAAEDFELMWRASRRGLHIANLPEVLLIKEEFPGSISQKRRRKQILSRLRIQWANRNLLSARSWAGLVKSSVQFATPASFTLAVKKIIYR